MQSWRSSPFQLFRCNTQYRELAQLLGRQQAKSVLQACPRSRFTHSTTAQSSIRLSCKNLFRPRPRTIPRPRHQSRFNSTNPDPSKRPNPDPTANLGSPEPGLDSPSLSLSQRFRKLSREYGWSAVAVYFGLSLLDFPFCFLAVRLLGTERIGRWEHIVIGWAWRLATLDGRLGAPQTSDSHDEEAIGTEVEGGSGMVAVSQEGGRILDQASQGQAFGWGVEEAEQAIKKSDATIWTQLALAYAIHKSFIFVRVPLTAAVTPKVVKVLRGWGWDIGKRKPKAVKGTSINSN